MIVLFFSAHFHNGGNVEFGFSIASVRLAMRSRGWVGCSVSVFKMTRLGQFPDVLEASRTEAQGVGIPAKAGPTR